MWSARWNGNHCGLELSWWQHPDCFYSPKFLAVILSNIELDNSSFNCSTSLCKRQQQWHDSFANELSLMKLFVYANLFFTQIRWIEMEIDAFTPNTEAVFGRISYLKRKRLKTLFRRHSNWDSDEDDSENISIFFVHAWNTNFTRQTFDGIARFIEGKSRFLTQHEVVESLPIDNLELSQEESFGFRSRQRLMVEEKDEIIAPGDWRMKDVVSRFVCVLNLRR